MATQKILVVEDEPNTAQMLVAYFEAQGYDVTAVGWGKKALDYLEETLPDLIVLDIRLPDIDGYEVCRQVRAHRRTAHIPIIFLTERRERIDRLTGLELGAVDYVTKPFDIQELRLRIRNVLRRADLDPVVHPVTGLPYASVAEERLSLALEQDRWAVVAVSLDGLGDFSDTYGFVARDDVLRAVALIVEHIARDEAGRDSFVGQLGSDTFFMLTKPERVQRVHQRLTSRLKEALVFFYPRTDWEAGRKGDGGVLPRLSVYIGVVDHSSGSYQDVDALILAIRDSLELYE
ncbi:MAG: response regulator [Anaerolineae bacterium]|jgi:PleD family two-component response regulator